MSSIAELMLTFYWGIYKYTVLYYENYRIINKHATARFLEMLSSRLLVKKYN